MSSLSTDKSTSQQAGDPDFETLLNYVRLHRGFDFTGYKRNTLMRRVQRRMELVKCNTYPEYLTLLEANPAEFTDLFNTILINVTDFFRDPEAWVYIAETVIPILVESKRREEQIRVWSAGCAGGQEAYTIAMLLAEALGEDDFRERVKIYATDVDEEALNEARQGSYSPKEVQHIPLPLLEKYFRPQNKRFVFRTDLRRALIFGRHDLVQDAPISRLDMLVCRNLLMYFNTETQRRVLDRFHFALNSTGYLMLGHAEMLLTHTSLFSPVHLKRRIFSKVAKPRQRDRATILEPTEIEELMTSVTVETRLHLRAFEVNPLAQVVIDADGHLTMANDQAQSLFGLIRRDIGRPLQDLETFYRPIELRPALVQAYATRRPVLFKDVSWPTLAGENRIFDVQVLPIFDPIDPINEVLGALVIYTDVTFIARLQEQLEHTNQELETAYEELQSTNEELETTNEELQSTIEELETTNEELHSTNEELETINEELQSTNEELETLNSELQRSGDELNHVNNFMETIFANLPSAIIVLDRAHLVQVWSERAEALWGLRAEEALGHHFMNLDIGFPTEELKVPIRACLAGEEHPVPQVFPATNRRGKMITCKTACMALRTNPDSVSGVIILIEQIGD